MRKIPHSDLCLYVDGRHNVHPICMTLAPRTQSGSLHVLVHLQCGGKSTHASMFRSSAFATVQEMPRRPKTDAEAVVSPAGGVAIINSLMIQNGFRTALPCAHANISALPLKLRRGVAVLFLLENT